MNAVAKDIMNTNVISVKVGTNLKEAVQILNENKINGLPVLDDNDNLVGILTESDIIQYSSKTHVTSTMDKSGWTSPYEKTWEKTGYQLGANILHRASVESVMSKKVVTVQLDTAMTDIAKTMRKKDINHLPVLDKDNRLCGIIAREDIISYLATVEK